MPASALRDADRREFGLSCSQGGRGPAAAVGGPGCERMYVSDQEARTPVMELRRPPPRFGTPTGERVRLFLFARRAGGPPRQWAEPAPERISAKRSRARGALAWQAPGVEKSRVPRCPGGGDRNARVGAQGQMGPDAGALGAAMGVPGSAGFHVKQLG